MEDRENILPEARKVVQADSSCSEISPVLSEEEKLLLSSAWYSHGIEAAYKAKERIVDYQR